MKNELVVIFQNDYPIIAYVLGISHLGKIAEKYTIYKDEKFYDILKKFPEAGPISTWFIGRCTKKEFELINTNLRLNRMEEYLNQLASNIKPEVLVSAFRDQLRNELKGWKQLTSELCLGAMFVNCGAEVCPHVPLREQGGDSNFDWQVALRGLTYNIEVKTIENNFLRYTSKEFNAKVQEYLSLPCGVTIEFRTLPNFNDAKAIAKEITQFYDYFKSYSAEGEKDLKCHIIGDAILLQEDNPIMSITFNVTEPANSMIVINGAYGSMMEPELARELGIKREKYEQNPFHTKIRDVIAKAVVQLPEEQFNIVALAGEDKHFHEHVFYAIFGDVIGLDRDGRERLYPNGIKYDVCYENVRDKIAGIISMQFETWHERPEIKLFKISEKQDRLFEPLISLII